MTSKPSCKYCSDTFRSKKDAEEHYTRFHKPPTFTKDGKITLNASDQIILEVKGNITWDEYFKSLNPKRVHKSFFEGGLALQRWELRNNIEFLPYKDGLRFRSTLV